MKVIPATRSATAVIVEHHLYPPRSEAIAAGDASSLVGDAS
jgi:hypothetical protein